MEDNFDDWDENSPSGIYTDISDYLESKFNYPNAGPDNVKPVTNATGFDRWLADHFRE